GNASGRYRLKDFSKNYDTTYLEDMTIDELVTRTAKHVDTLDASTTDEIVARVVSTPPSRRHTSPRTITLNLPIPPQGATNLIEGSWHLE
ncbi:hypothetical protein ACC674_37960, partial [Rhizobium ruizarguesonis]